MTTSRSPTRAFLGRRTTAALAAALLAAPQAGAQTARIAAWGSYDGVTNSANWSTAGGQFTVAAARGDRVWIAAERVGRFGSSDAPVRIGGVLHPGTRWWITLEAGSALRPTFSPKNTWDADVTALIAGRAALGIGYRRWNYAVGPVDFVTTHLSFPTGRVSWDLRVPLSRNPSERVDAAVALRATAELSPRVAVWGLGAVGRESYVVGTAPTALVQSLQTETGAAGMHLKVGSGLTINLEATVVRSRPVLSRRGVTLGIEQRF